MHRRSFDIVYRVLEMKHLGFEEIVDMLESKAESTARSHWIQVPEGDLSENCEEKSRLSNGDAPKVMKEYNSCLERIKW